MKCVCILFFLLVWAALLCTGIFYAKTNSGWSSFTNRVFSSFSTHNMRSVSAAIAHNDASAADLFSM